MVIRHAEYDELSFHEVGLIEDNLAMYGDLKFRAQVVKAVHDSIKEQVRHRVQARIGGSEYEPTRTAHISHEMTEKIIESLRQPAFDETAQYVSGREDLQAVIHSYDNARREQIIVR